MTGPKFDGIHDALSYVRAAYCASVYPPTIGSNMAADGNEPPPEGEAILPRRVRPWLDGMPVQDRRALAGRVMKTIRKLAGETDHALIELRNLPAAIYDRKGVDLDPEVAARRETAAAWLARALHRKQKFILQAYPAKVTNLPIGYLTDVCRVFGRARPKQRFPVWAHSLRIDPRNERKGRALVRGIMFDMHSVAFEIAGKALQRNGISA